MRNKTHRPPQAGFTLVEAVVGTAIFGIILVGILGVFATLSRAAKINREQTILTTLAQGYLEIVRNLPYSEIGTVNGNPPGNLPDLINAVVVNIENKSFKIYYEVTYVDDPADGTIAAGTDGAPNDYKQVKMFVQNVTTTAVTSFLSNFVPQGLENTTNAGALSIQVFNAQGLPVPNANIHIENLTLVPNLILDRQTDQNGNWIEVGLPASVNGYYIVVSKTGYSTDQTYPITSQNPNPVKPDATIVNGQVTQISFSIDLLATLNIKTLNQTCQNLNNIGVNVRGGKLIGTNPDVYKFNQNYSSVNGLIALNNIEWDTYTPTLLTGQGLMIYGTSPVQSIDLLPGSTQTFTLVLGAETTNSLLVIVKDAGSGNLLEGAAVHLRKGDSIPQDYYGTTGGSIWVQQDWTGGSGQAEFVDPTQYFWDDGNVDVNSVPTGIRLKKLTGRYVPAGELISSTFDTGTSATAYTTLIWQPATQNPGTLLQLQIASNNDNATWNFVGPDGTASTFYTVSGMTINPVHNNNRYIRYRVLLSTTDDKKTPILTSLGINYVSGCFTPGQTIFPGLTAGNNYDLDVTLTGYQTQIINNLNINGNQAIEVLLSP